MALKRKTRMYEPWGYREENNYQGNETILDNDLESFFAGTSYNKDDNKIYFTNKDGETKASLDVSEFVKSDSIIEKTEYKDGILKIYFTNGDIITIDLTELLDENEFKDGLTIDDHVVKVLIDSTSEPYLSVSENGVKISGVDAAIQVETDRATAAEKALDEKIEAEIARATSAETALDEKINAETARATSAETDLQAAIEAEGQRAQDAETALDEKIDAEETRAKAREDEIETALNAEKTRATQTEQALDGRINTLNDELDSEESRAQSAEQELRLLITTEIADRKADVDEEEARAKEAEQALQNAIDAEEARATSAETALDEKIDAETARATSAETTLDEKIAALRQSLEDEIDRATSAETKLFDVIEAEVEERKAEAIASVEYDSSGKTIDFYNANNVKIDSIDATAFIKDGMIDSVRLETTGGTTYLVIVWNTDAGKETTRIDIGDIFEADNYYTKDETDAIVDDLEGEDIASGNIASDATVSIKKNNGDVITFSSANEIDLEAGEF
jgi:hypothetical protein